MEVKVEDIIRAAHAEFTKGLPAIRRAIFAVLKELCLVRRATGGVSGQLPVIVQDIMIGKHGSRPV